MGKLTQEQRSIIKKAIDLTNEIPICTIEQTDQIPNYLKQISRHPEILYQTFADISFKLYVLKYTKTERDFVRLSSYISILEMLISLYYGEYRKNIAAVVTQIKMAYPRVGDDTIFEDFEKALDDIYEKRMFHLGTFFVYAMKFNDYLAGSAVVMRKTTEALNLYTKRAIEYQAKWEYIGPIFKACAAQIKPEFNVDQRGEVFSRFFYGPGDGKLEGQLKKHGEWVLEEGESDTHARIRIRKDYIKRFNSWMKRRENANHELEMKLIECFEKNFWHKETTEQLLSPILNQIAQSNTSPDDIDESMKQLQEFAKGIKLE